MSFEFDALKYSYASRRSLVYGRRGMVSTSQPLAAQAGLDIIKKEIGRASCRERV